MKKLLVTGGTGFLGNKLMKYLEKEFTTYYLVRKDYNLKNQIICDLSNLQIEDTHYDAIFHMAAITKFNDQSDFNITSTKNLINFAKKNKITRFFYISTAFVCGKHTGKFTKDDFDLNQEFNNNYEKTKFESEKLVRESGLDWTIFRPSIIYDKNDLSKGIGFQYIVWAYKNDKITEIPGNPNNKIYLIEIKEVIKKILLNMNDISKMKTIHIINSLLLKDIINTYSHIFNKKKLKIISRNNVKDQMIKHLLPYIDTKVEFE